MKKLILLSVLILGTGSVMPMDQMTTNLQKNLLANTNNLIQLMNLVHNCPALRSVVNSCGMTQVCYSTAANLNAIVKGMYSSDAGCTEVFSFVMKNAN